MPEEAAAAGSSRNSAFNQWAITIKETLENEIQGYVKPAQKNPPRRTIFRVRKRTKESVHGRRDMACYTPESISLGLFHRPGRYDAPQKGENFKLQMAVAFLTSIHTYEPRQNEDLGELRNSESSRSGQVVDDVAESSRTENGTRGSDVRLAQSLKQFLSAGRSEHAWKALSHSVVGEAGLRKAIGHYDLQEDDRIKDDEPAELLQWVLTLDAIVVACLFAANFCRAGESTLPFPMVRDCVDQHSVYGTVPVEDFIKLENQIPLFLPRKVLNLMCTSTEEAKTILNGACAKLAHDFACYLPGHDPNKNDVLIKQLKQEKAFLQCDHLLECVALVLRLPGERDGAATEEHSQPEPVNSWTWHLRSTVANGIGKSTASPATAPWTTPKGFNVPSASLLLQAGIKVRGCSRSNGPDLLPIFEQGWLRGTLYVPKLPILPAVTWTLWRNIVAYECERNREHGNRKRKGQRERSKKYHRQESQLHAFLALMDCLVDTKDDVLLLTQGKTPVLHEGYTSNPEVLAEMFNTILAGQPFVDSERWILLADQINNYHKHRLRKNVLEFGKSYFGKPWLVICVLAAVALFILTFLQTFYVMLTFYKPSV